MAEEIKKTLRGRPLAFILTQEMLDEIQKLSSCGLNQRQIRDYYGIAHTTWQTKRRRFPEILEYFNKGKSKGTAFVANKLMELVKKGHFNAIRFYLETVGEFGTAADDEENEEKKPVSALTITVTDPIEAAKIYQEIMKGTMKS
jgi:hypothetical protein